jgi:hypothetical protein
MINQLLEGDIHVLVICGRYESGSLTNIDDFINLYKIKENHSVRTQRNKVENASGLLLMIRDSRV